MFKPNDKLPITRHEKLETINVHMVRGRVHQLPAIQTVFAAIHRLFDFRFLQIEEFSRFGPFAPICEPLTNQAVSESVNWSKSPRGTFRGIRRDRPNPLHGAKVLDPTVQCKRLSTLYWPTDRTGKITA